MADYGISVKDVDGDVIATTDQYTKFAFEFGTVVGMDTNTIVRSASVFNAQHLNGTYNTIIRPQFYQYDTARDYVPSSFVYDVAYSTYAATYSVSCVQMSLSLLTTINSYAGPKYNAAFKTGEVGIGHLQTSNSNTVILRTVFNASDTSENYDVFHFNKCVDYAVGTSYNFTARRRLGVVPPDGYIGGLEIWARPQSASYSGQFCLYFGIGVRKRYGGLENFPPVSGQLPLNGDYTYANAFAILDLTGGNNTFEVALVDSGYVVGYYEGAQSSGSSNYGFEIYSQSVLQIVLTESVFPLSNSVISTTEALNFSSALRPLRFIASKGVPDSSVSWGTQTDFTLGTIPTSTTKRWVRMTDTLAWKRGGGFGSETEYRMTYNWASNNNISLRWREANDAMGDTYGLVQTGRYEYDKLFAIAEFGDGL